MDFISSSILTNSSIQASCSSSDRNSLFSGTSAIDVLWLLHRYTNLSHLTTIQASFPFLLFLNIPWENPVDTGRDYTSPRHPQYRSDDKVWLPVSSILGSRSRHRAYIHAFVHLPWICRDDLTPICARLTAYFVLPEAVGPNMPDQIFVHSTNLHYFCTPMPKAKSKIEIKNKRASFEYEFIESFTFEHCPHRNRDQIDTCRKGLADRLLLLFCRQGAICKEYVPTTGGVHSTNTTRGVAECFFPQRLSCFVPHMKEGMTIVATRYSISRERVHSWIYPLAKRHDMINITPSRRKILENKNRINLSNEDNPLYSIHQIASLLVQNVSL